MLRASIVAVMLTMFGVSVSGQGGQPADALKQCFADKTTGKDRKDLAKWIFLAMAAHPEMKQHVTPDAQAASDESSRTMGALVTRLLAEDCTNEMKAVGENPSQALESAFSGLGQLAMRELMVDPSVEASMGLMGRYVDQKKVAAAFSPK